MPGILIGVTKGDTGSLGCGCQSRALTSQSMFPSPLGFRVILGLCSYWKRKWHLSGLRVYCFPFPLQLTPLACTSVLSFGHRSLKSAVWRPL